MPLSRDTTVRQIFLDACQRNDLNKVRQVLALGANVNWRRNSDGISGLQFAAENNYGELLELLLAQTGVDVNIRTNGNVTPLMLACYEGHENIVRRLCQADWSTAEVRD